MGKSKELAELGDVVTQDSGNMLVGTTGHFNYSGSTTEITVGTGQTGSSAGGAVTFVSNNGATTLGYAGFQETQALIGTMGSRPLGFTTNNTERMTITSSGNVGIGTTSPSEKLHVSGGTNDRIVVSGSGSSGLLFENTGGTTLFQIVYDDASTDSTFITTSDDLVFRNQGGTQGGSITARMTIDASGRVTKPYQPAFHAHKNSSQGETSGANAVTGWVVDYQTGSNFNASTGRFTAPVAGMYSFNFSAMFYNCSGDTQWRWYRNGVYYSGSNFTGHAGNLGQVTIPAIVYLNANDYMEPYVYSNITTSGEQVYGNRYSHVSGYLIG